MMQTRLDFSYGQFTASPFAALKVAVSQKFSDSLGLPFVALRLIITGIQDQQI